VAEGRDLAAFHATFRKFLDAWLIKKDLAGAQSFFSSELSSNPLIFGSPAMGGLDDTERANPQRVRSELANFLKESTKAFDAKDIGELLEPPFDRDRLGLKANPLNQVQRDKYAVFHFEFRLLNKLRETPAGEKARDFFTRETRTGKLFLVLTFLKGGGLTYWVWKLEAGSWRVLHVDVVQM
jgi:hypothetical protein